MFFGKKRNPEEHRYYLLPGQGRGARKKFHQQMWAALFAGLFFSALVGGALWYMNSHH
jgi:hypothetical protein